MRFGICTSLDKIEFAKSKDIDYLELNLSETCGLSDELFEKTKEKLFKTELKSEVFNCTYGNQKLIGKEYNKNEIVTYLNKAFKRAKELGAFYIVFGSGRSRKIPDEYDFHKGYQELVEVTKLMATIAKDYDLSIIIEPLSIGECNVITSVNAACNLIRNTNCDNVFALCDFYHHMKNKLNFNELVENKEYIRHIHIASFPDRLYPTIQDECDYTPLINSLKEINYQGRISVECSQNDYYTICRKSMEFFNSKFKF